MTKFAIFRKDINPTKTRRLIRGIAIILVLCRKRGRAATHRIKVCLLNRASDTTRFQAISPLPRITASGSNKLMPVPIVRADRGYCRCPHQVPPQPSGNTVITSIKTRCCAGGKIYFLCVINMERNCCKNQK